MVQPFQNLLYISKSQYFNLKPNLIKLFTTFFEAYNLVKSHQERLDFKNDIFEEEENS